MTRSGLLLVDKASGWRSRQVVDAIAKRFHIAKIGHAGTLDPGATGLLIILIGEGTKLSRFLMGGRKTYRATIRLGITTDTYDADGTVIAERPLGALAVGDVEVALGRFRGRILQRPPDFAAVKVGGRPAYSYARRGEEVELAEREVTVYSLDLMRCEFPDIEIEMSCSKGTYVRSLAHDLGEMLGMGGHLLSIRRLASEPYDVSVAHSVDRLLELDASGLDAAVIPLDRALPHVARIDAGDELARCVRSGKAISGELLYGLLPASLKRGDLVQICTADRIAVCDVLVPPMELGPPPWSGRNPLRYQRVLLLE